MNTTEESDAGDRFTFELLNTGFGPRAVTASWLPKISKRAFGRVTVLLGANGCGKSRLLKSLSASPVVNGITRPAIHVEGGRSLSLPSRQRFRDNALRNEVQRDEVGARKKYRTQTFQQRLPMMLALIDKDHEMLLQSQLQELRIWKKSGGTQPSLDSLDAAARLSASFREVFPHISVDKNSSGEWECTKGQYVYGLDALSDGEKQVLCLLGDVIELADNNPLVIIDEPELNLHPSLAVNLWNTIEDKKPDAVFVYATHSLSFAMRPNVTDVVILGPPDTEPIHITPQTHPEWPGEQMEPFLGMFPAIITSGRAIITEGKKDQSFDQAFYRWIVGGSVSVACVGSCDDVRSAIIREGVWNKIGTAVLRGVVDRDYRTPDRIASFEKAQCLVLPYHEAESYLCIPAIIAIAATYSEVQITESDALDELCKLCERHLIRTAVNRTIQLTETRLRIGPGKDEPMPKHYEMALADIETWITKEAPRSSQLIAGAVDIFKKEHEQCKQAIASKNVDQMLTLFPGKEIGFEIRLSSETASSSRGAISNSTSRATRIAT